MDGTNSAFLYDSQFLSSREDDAGGILYMEDFDSDLRAREPVVEDKPASAPVFTKADVEHARAEGRVEGLQSALTDATLTRAQLEAAALQSLADGLSAARVTLERVAAHHAAECVRAIIAVMSAAIPATMVRHGEFEIQAMLDILLPGLACEPELRVRASPELADTVRERLGERLPNHGIVLSVVGDTAFAFGDVDIVWEQGRARRDCNAIWQAIRSAVAPMNLPPIEELCYINGS